MAAMQSMYQAITTKWLGPTNTKGSRIKATCAAGSLTIAWDYSMNVSDNHAKAAQALIDKMGWHGDWTGGELPDPHNGYAFVLVRRY